jgi:hypothetical protein
MRSFHRSLIVTGTLALGIAVAGAAHAQTSSYTRSESTTYTDQSDWDAYNRPGPYVGVGGSYMVPGFQGGARSADFGDTLGFNVRGGYRLNEYWAFEGLYEYGDFNAHDVLAGEHVQTNTFMGGAKLILPLGRFQPYLSGSAGFVNANADKSLRRTNWDVDGTNFAGRFGGGVDLFATENVAIFLDASYTMPIKEVSDLYYFSFGWGAKYVF